MHSHPGRDPYQRGDRESDIVKRVKPKRHHYVPQFYLRYFSSLSPDGVFWVYDKDGGPPRPQTPTNTAVETHFYSVDTPEGGRDTRLEEALAKLESAAKPILDRWQINGARPTAIEISEIAEFFAFMHARVPRTHRLVKELEEAITIEALREVVWVISGTCGSDATVRAPAACR